MPPGTAPHSPLLGGWRKMVPIDPTNNTAKTTEWTHPCTRSHDQHQTVPLNISRIVQPKEFYPTRRHLSFRVYQYVLPPPPPRPHRDYQQHLSSDFIHIRNICQSGIGLGCKAERVDLVRNLADMTGQPKCGGISSPEVKKTGRPTRRGAIPKSAASP